MDGSKVWANKNNTSSSICRYNLRNAGGEGGKERETGEGSTDVGMVVEAVGFPSSPLKDEEEGGGGRVWGLSSMDTAAVAVRVAVKTAPLGAESEGFASLSGIRAALGMVVVVVELGIPPAENVRAPEGGVSTGGVLVVEDVVVTVGEGEAREGPADEEDGVSISAGGTNNRNESELRV